MRNMFSVSIKVTTPYKLKNEQDIKNDILTDTLTETLKMFIEGELANYNITGLNVEVKVK